MSDSSSTERLAELLSARHRTLGKLRVVSARQIQVLQRDAIGELHELLAVKQTLIEDLVRVDQAIDPYRAEDPERRVWSSPDVRERCRQLVEECTRWLDEVKEFEAGAERLARERMETTSREMETHVDRSRAVAAYLRTDRNVPAGRVVREG
ncbi:MAG TPA: hypothetical protein DCQ98_12770 [Planctomycetaceae bacterium]|nr:hypothetical protein [Planctomycetaceae bacterium]HRE98915.1 hypothetical protein [Pirellulaceae bacterium]